MCFRIKRAEEIQICGKRQWKSGYRFYSVLCANVALCCLSELVMICTSFGSLNHSTFKEKTFMSTLILCLLLISDRLMYVRVRNVMVLLNYASVCVLVGSSNLNFFSQ